MTPDLFTPAWFSALFSIVLIDLVLAGDNALVIGLAARNVPANLQRRVVLYGTIGAIAVRALLTGAVVWLLKIPGFMLVGGIALIYVAFRLTRGGGEQHDIARRSSVRGAVQTIIVADAVMGIDNVLAVGGAAHGSMLLVLFGLALSIPLVVWGSTLVLRWVERYPAIVWLGAGVLGWTAAKMIGGEALLADWFDAWPATRTALYLLAVGGVVAQPLWRSLGPSHRLEVAALLLLAAWLTGFGWLETRMDIHFERFDNWQFADEAIDLVRWIGWIPVLFALRPLYAALSRKRHDTEHATGSG